MTRVTALEVLKLYQAHRVYLFLEYVSGKTEALLSMLNADLCEVSNAVLGSVVVMGWASVPTQEGLRRTHLNTTVRGRPCRASAWGPDWWVHLCGSSLSGEGALCLPRGFCFWWISGDASSKLLFCLC